MTRPRAITGLLVVLGAAVMAVSVGSMIGRITRYYDKVGQSLPVFSTIDQREFDFHGLHVAIADVPDPGAGETVVVRFGPTELRLSPTVEPRSAQVPGLARHEEWLKVLRFVEQGRTPPAELNAQLAHGEVKERLVIVVRDPRRALDGTAHGLGSPADSTFDLHELLPDGTIRSARYGFPLSRRAAQAASASEAPVAGIPPLQEGTWQYYAALMTIPRSSRPTPAFTRDAVRSMGWTLPAAAFSGLLLTLALPALLAPRGRAAAVAAR